MTKKLTLVLCAVLLSVMLAACGGDDPDPTATPPAAPTATEAAADDAAGEEAPTEVAATPTEAAAAATPTEETVMPTTEPEPTGTVAPASTVEPTATAEAATVDPTATGETTAPEPTPEVDSEAEAALFEMALAEEDLPEGWMLTFSDVVTESELDTTFCNVDPFSSPGGRIAAVELEFEISVDEGPFLLQNLTAYPEEVSIEAMEYARTEIVSCDEWTDEFDTTYQIQDLELPAYGDESFAVLLSFEIPEAGQVPVAFAFVRVDGILISVGYIDMVEIDMQQLETIIERAVEKVEASDYRP